MSKFIVRHPNIEAYMIHGYEFSDRGTDGSTLFIDVAMKADWTIGRFKDIRFTFEDTISLYFMDSQGGDTELIQFNDCALEEIYASGSFNENGVVTIRLGYLVGEIIYRAP